eukprot:1189849-Prorocentrum_minimum.AAC.1
MTTNGKQGNVSRGHPRTGDDDQSNGSLAGSGKESTQGVDMATTGVDGSTTGVDGSTTGVDLATTGVDGSTTGVDGSTTGVDGSTTGVDRFTQGVDGFTQGVDCLFHGGNRCCSNTGWACVPVGRGRGGGSFVVK